MINVQLSISRMEVMLSQLYRCLFQSMCSLYMYVLLRETVLYLVGSMHHLTCWYRWYRQFTILLHYIFLPMIIWVIHNIENIVITELKIRFLPPDLTLVQSEMVVLGVLGYSRTQHPAFYDEGILSVSGHCHLGELDYELFPIQFLHQICGSQII